MKSFIRLVMLVLIISGWGLAASSLHVVRTQKDRILLVPKQRLSLRETYVDARAWTLADVAAHPAVTERIVQSGKADELKYVVGQVTTDAATALTEAIKNPPTVSTGDKHATAADVGAASTPKTIHLPLTIGI